MSDTILSMLIAAGVFLLMFVAYLALQQARRANMLSAMNIMERLLGKQYPIKEVETSELLNPENYKVIDLLKAGRLASAAEMSFETILQENYSLEAFLTNIKTFGDKVTLVKEITDSKGNMLVALMRVIKGQKFFTLAFRVMARRVEETIIPEPLRKYIRVHKDDKHTFMWVIHQAVILRGKTGYEVKEDFINNLITIAALPEDLTVDRYANVKFSRFAEVNGVLSTQQLSKDPTKGYLPIHSGRTLTLQYHGESYLVPQGQAITLIAKHAILEDGSTVFLQGDPNSGKTAFATFLQRELAKADNTDVILGTGEDLSILSSLKGRELQTIWTEESSEKRRIIFIDDAISQLEDPELTQNLLSLMDGQTKNLTRTSLVLSVNRSLENVPADLKRPGRKSVTLLFDPIDAVEAHDLIKEISGKITPPKAITDRVEEGKLYQIGEIFDWITNDNVTKGGLEQALKNKEIVVSEKKSVTKSVQSVVVPKGK